MTSIRMNRMCMSSDVAIYKENIMMIIDSIIKKDKKLFYDSQAGGSIKFEDVMREIQEYGAITLIPVPDEEFAWADIYKTSNGKEWIELPLWTKEEGMSDLYIYFICSHDNDYIEIRVADIHIP
jgi:uncharacterized protein YjaG (DUF416 family)